MAWFIPAIMALGHGAAAAGAAVGHGAAVAGEAVAHGAEAAGHGIEHGAQAVGSKLGIGGGSAASDSGAAMPAAGSVGSLPPIEPPMTGSSPGPGLMAGGQGSFKTAAGNNVIDASTKAPSLLDKADAFMQRPSVKAAQNGASDLMKGAQGGGGVPNNQPGEQVENPIAPSPSFPGGDSAMPQALMPGSMDAPFGASGRRALSDTLLRNGG